MELDTVRQLNRKVKALEDKIERLRDAQQSTVPVIDGMPKSRGRGTSRLEELTTQIMTLEEELNAVKDELIASTVDLTLEILERVPHPAADVLLERYTACKPFKPIVTSSGYSEQHIFRLHRDGVKAFKAAS